MVNFASVKGITIPEGEVKSIARNGTILWQKKSSRLPAEYQEVEYIRSTGPQYIDTGVKPTNTYKIEVKFNIETLASSFGIIYGGETDYNRNAFHLYNTSNTFDIGFGSGAVYGTIPYNQNTDYTVIVSNGSIIINDTSYNGPSGTINPPYNVYLFALKRPSLVVDPTCSKIIYYCKFYNNDVLIKEFIPCYRKSDGVIGMYDLVNDEFKTNIGSGTFGKGNDV